MQKKKIINISQPKLKKKKSYSVEILRNRNKDFKTVVGTAGQHIESKTWKKNFSELFFFLYKWNKIWLTKQIRASIGLSYDRALYRTRRLLSGMDSHIGQIYIENYGQGT